MGCRKVGTGFQLRKRVLAVTQIVSEPQRDKNMRKLQVTYTVTYTTVIEVPENVTEQDALSDISIPENAENVYKEDTFEVNEVIEI